MQSITAIGDLREVTMEGCNFEFGDSPEVFDASDPSGTYELDLDNSPYDRAVANSLLLLANTKKGCELTKIMHNGKSLRVQRASAEAEESVSTKVKEAAEQGTAIKGLRVTPAYVKHLFKMFDADGSGTIDVRELREMLAGVWERPTDKEMASLLERFDGA